MFQPQPSSLNIWQMCTGYRRKQIMFLVPWTSICPFLLFPSKTSFSKRSHSHMLLDHTFQPIVDQWWKVSKWFWLLHAQLSVRYGILFLLPFPLVGEVGSLQALTFPYGPSFRTGTHRTTICSSSERWELRITVGTESLELLFQEVLPKLCIYQTYSLSPTF